MFFISNIADLKLNGRENNSIKRRKLFKTAGSRLLYHRTIQSQQKTVLDLSQTTCVTVV